MYSTLHLGSTQTSQTTTPYYTDTAFDTVEGTVIPYKTNNAKIILLGDMNAGTCKKANFKVFSDFD